MAVDGESLTVFDRTALAALKAKCPNGKLDILIVGSTAAVSSAVKSALDSFGTVSKRFNGANRYETNSMVYNYGVSHGGWSNADVFIARGDSFPDALTIAPYLHWMKCPIALVDPSAKSLSEDATAIISSADQVVVLGSDAAVPEHLKTQAESACAGGSALRLGGADRYETSSLIVQWEVKQGMTLEGAGVATGTNFPDALSSSYLLGQGGSVLMLMSPMGENSPMTETVKAIASSNGSPSLLRVFGSTAAIPLPTRAQLTTAAGWASYAESNKNEDMQSKAAFVKSSSKCSQMIIVEASGTTATVSLHAKDSSGKWRETLSTGGYVGRDGIGTASESRAVTPVGAFDIPFAFGNASNPGTSLAWHGTTWDSTWVDDPASRYYNTWQESTSYSGEPLRSIGAIYDYALVIGYNYPKYCTTRDSRTVSGAGSAFFLHCSEGKPTGGCVSVPYSTMRKIVTLVKPGCLIVIGDCNTVYTY